VISLNKDEREGLWDDLYVKEEGVILEFDPDSDTGKVKSLHDENIFSIDPRELIRTMVQLCPGDKVLFAPFEDPDGNNYAMIIRVVEYNV